MTKLVALVVGATMLAGCGKLHHILGEFDGPQVVGSGKVTTVSRTVGSFKAVELEGSVDADIKFGPQSAIKITGDDNIVPMVKTEIKNGVLHIYCKGSYSTHNNLKVAFTVPTLDSAGVSGSGDMVLHGYKGNALSLSIAGSGDVTVDGSVDKLSSSIQGSGDMKLFGMHARTAEVSISGSGDAEVYATSSLDASIAGSGSVTYKGKPKVSKSIAGSGDVTSGE